MNLRIYVFKENKKLHMHLRGANQQIREHSSVIPSLLGVMKNGFGFSKNV